MSTSPVHNQSVIPPNSAALSSIQSNNASHQQTRTDAVAQTLLDSKAPASEERTNIESLESKKAKKKAYQQHYYRLHKEELKAKQKVYNQSHREERRAYEALHKEEISARNAEYYRLHLKERKAYRTAYNRLHRDKRAEYYQLHKVEIAAKRALYNKSHKEKKRAYDLGYLRAAKEGTLEKFKKEWAERQKLQMALDPGVSPEGARPDSTTYQSSTIPSSSVAINAWILADLDSADFARQTRIEASKTRNSTEENHSQIEKTDDCENTSNRSSQCEAARLCPIAVIPNSSNLTEGGINTAPIPPPLHLFNKLTQGDENPPGNSVPEQRNLQSGRWPVIGESMENFFEEHFERPD